MAGPYYFPWQFPVSAYGAQANGKIVTDGQITTGTNLLTCATSAPFLPGDAGKAIVVSCAGGGTYTPLATTILSYVGATQVHLTVNATSTTPGNSITAYATDDTTAIKNAVAAATAYAQANNGYAEIVFDSATLHGVAGGAVVGGTTLGNAQIPLPIISSTAPKIVLVFTTTSKGYGQALQHWNQTSPQAAGACLLCLRADGTNDVTYGPASMVGGPFHGYGGDLGLFSNCMPVVDGLQMIMPYNSTYAGWDFFGMAEAHVEKGSAMTLAVVPAAPPYPNITNYNNITNTWTFGVRMPCTGNNDRCDIFSFSCEGLCYGIMPSEHTVADISRAIYCIIGVEGYSGQGGMPHAARIGYASVEGSAQGAGFFDATVNMDIDTIDSESVTFKVYDPANNGTGTIGIRLGGVGGYFTNIVNGGAGIRPIILDQISGPVASPQAAVASGSPWQNQYCRDAWISLSASSITALTITGPNGGTAKAQSIPAGSTIVNFFLPSNSSYTWTGTGAATHQVTLA